MELAQKTTLMSKDTQDCMVPHPIPYRVDSTAWACSCFLHFYMFIIAVYAEVRLSCLRCSYGRLDGWDSVWAFFSCEGSPLSKGQTYIFESHSLSLVTFIK